MYLKMKIYLHKVIHEIFQISHFYQDPKKVSNYYTPRNVLCMYKVGERG